MLDPHFVILGAFFSAAGAANYIWTTLQGKTKPHVVTYIMWALAPLIAFAAELNEGVGLQSLMTLMVGLMPACLLLAVFISRQGIWKVSGFDIACGILSLVGLLLWLATRHGLIAIIFSILSDFLAGVPTLVKSYRYPETENWKGYFGGLANAAITLLTIKHWTFANYGFPLYILLICIALCSFIYFQPGLKFSRQS